jgi:thiamine kinase-like enzyme
VDASYVNDGIKAFFGVDIDVAAVSWTAAHCDLHWGNLTAPQLTILDWEMWGKAPAGYDAAGLLCATMTYPDSAERIRRTLRRFLDTPNGRVATLAAAVRYLRFADGGELTDLALPVRRLGQMVIEQL